MTAKTALGNDWIRRLVRIRRALGMQQKALAAEFGVNQSEVSRWESG